MRSYYDFELGYLDFEFKDDEGTYFNPDQDSTFYAEVYDAEDVLQAVYGLTTTPAITRISTGQYRVSDIPLTGFAEGLAYFKVYANVNGVESASGSWSVCFSESLGRHIHFVYCDPYTGYLYASEGDSGHQQIIRSKDRGVTWETIKSGNVLAQPISALSTRDFRFFGSDAGGSSGLNNCVLRTADDVNFEVSLDLVGSRDTLVWAMTQDGDGLLLAGTTCVSSGQSPAIYMSSDGGDTWTIVKDFGTQTASMKGVTWMSNFDGDGWFYYQCELTSPSGVFVFRGRIDDGVFSEEVLEAPVSGQIARTMWVGPDNRLFAFAYGTPEGIYVSEDRGDTWDPIYYFSDSGTGCQGLFVGLNEIVYVGRRYLGKLYRGEYTGSAWVWTTPVTFMGAAMNPKAAMWKGCQSKDGDILVGEYGGGTSEHDAYIWRAPYSGAIQPHPYLEYCFQIIESDTTGGLCSLEDLKEHLEITGTDQDTFLLKLIGRTTAFIESYCGRHLASQTVTERYTGDRTSRLNLRQFPVTSITSIEDTSDSSMFEYAASDEHDYWECDYDAGIIELLSDTFTPYPIKAIEIVYVAGYVNIPEDLKQTCIELAAAKFYLKDKQRQGIQSKSTGGQTITYAPDELSQAQKLVLDRYARITVGAV